MALFLLYALCFALSLCYAGLVGAYLAGWCALPDWEPPADAAPSTSVSLIIAARNEEDNIAACLQSIKAQDYPQHLLEIVVVDDHSSDQTPHIIGWWATQMPKLKSLRLADALPEGSSANSYKKMALEHGIANSSGELIVTTDADCTAPPGWLRGLVAFYEQHKPQMMAAPVRFTAGKGFLNAFQRLDFAGMMVATGASVRLRLADMCNGANLAYTRRAFEAVNGFEGIDDIASGDDMLLMTKIRRRHPGGGRFVKSAAVTVATPPQPDLAGFANQRLRWASKSGRYNDRRVTVLLGAVYLFNWLVVICGAGALLLQHRGMGVAFAAMFALKCTADFCLLATGCRFFGQKKLLWWFFPAQLAHIAYILAVGSLGSFGKYNWKGRRVK